ncbi:MAG TPA: efflux RND transporter periplasmic adaptor subunit [Ramlibacter sp.]|jgi:RND family efflux transporter MFP subunit|nr:efflux RND transporter periplasmic adaptor subunit [Ramlibacter sp.]
MASKKSLLAAAACAVVLIAGAVWWLRAPAPKPSDSAAKSAGVLVTVTVAGKEDIPVNVVVNGNVVSLNSVDVKPQVSNVVEKVHVREGDVVHAGQPLFTLDARGDVANLQKAKAQQLKDQAQLSDLERQYKRSQELLAQNFIAKSATETVLSQLDAQRAAVAADRAAVQSAQVQLGYDDIRAPISGRTGAIPIFAGTLVQPAATLVTITQMDPIAVTFPVPEGSLQDLLDAAKQKSPVLATIPGRTQPVKGYLSFVDNTVDPSVGTVRAKAQFDNKDSVLWPGQYVNTSITVRTLKNATVIPVAAIITSPTGRIVYVVKDDVAQPRKVDLQYTTGERAVVQGLQPGERIVVEGKQNLRPGSRVRVERAVGQGNAPGAPT